MKFETRDSFRISFFIIKLTRIDDVKVNREKIDQCFLKPNLIYCFRGFTFASIT